MARPSVFTENSFKFSDQKNVRALYKPDSGGKVDKKNLTQVGRALGQRGILHIPAYSPEARGRSEHLFGTLQKRLPQELRSQGITTMDEANTFLKDVFVPDHNARFVRAPEDTASAFVDFTGTVEDILCVQEERVVAADNTLRYKGLTLQIPANRHRHHFVRARVRVHAYPDGKLALFYGPRCIGRCDANGQSYDKEEKTLGGKAA